ncbi:MAG: C-5 sterol desaturase [Gammaproteobacteria bacterium]|jgi:sterol desaturase/sphingolipid hydroxylase (fatty acid hydroxylase superfamily)|nr:C-5 sterol desaturase [Porticoccaceae bacterium]MBK79293.1 C-5 sterol desaturase [Gammaproteobacteria bacterium]HAF68193.1 C-5 sterol desaturase [Acidimicrobiaceae bacterium]|tara:strand:+ start:12351 stop:13319 length:969 start_codon:yes stop_codon:yes gene_type:complete
MDQLPELAPTHLAVPVFIAVMLLELLIGRVYGNAKFEMRDTGLNLLTSFVAGTERVLSGVLYAFVLMYVYQYRVFDFEFSWMLVAIVFVADDLIYYIKHRIEHTVRWAWASHVVHHSSQHFNTSVALRQTWTYALTGLILLYIPLVLIGVHPALLGFCAGVNLVYQFFLHTETIRRLPRWYEAIMNTPSHHRVHHATNPKYLDANYAGTFIIWDKLFGTFVPEDDNEPCRYGIVKNLHTFNVVRVAFHEWASIAKDVVRPGLSLRQRLNYMFKPPGWSHDGSRETSKMIKARHVRLNPTSAGGPGLPDVSEVQTEPKLATAS